jgi:hypothetical protein
MDLVPAKTSKHESNHSEIDHGFAGLGLPFVVPSESAGATQPSKGTFHDPTARHNLEGVKLGPFHNFDGAAPELARLFQQHPSIPSVGPDMFDATPRDLAEEGAQQLLSSFAVLDVCRQDHDQQNKTHGIDQNMAFATIDFLARIVASLVADFAAFDSLAVDDGRTGLSLAPFDQTEVFAQMGVNPIPQSVGFPESEVVVDRTPRREILRQVAPLTSSFDKVEDGVEQLSKRVPAPSASFGRLGKAVIDEWPFGIGEVRCISHPKRITACGARYKLTLTNSLSYFSNRL